MTLTLILIAAISIVSVMAFRDSSLMYRLQFNATKVYHNREWQRLISHAFVHGSYEHLLINMFVLWSFGQSIEYTFRYMSGRAGTSYYLMLFFGGVVVSSLYSLYKHRDNYYYNAVGASGGVASVIFASVFFDPWAKIYLIVIPIPGIVFAIIYLVYSYKMAQKNNDNVGHDAHFLGSLFGILFPILVYPSSLSDFIRELFKYF